MQQADSSSNLALKAIYTQFPERSNQILLLYLWVKKELSQALMCVIISWTHLIVKQKQHFHILICWQLLWSHILVMAHAS